MTPYYQDAFCTIYHGDCREVFAWRNADVLVTDPPYGVAYGSGWDNQFKDVRIHGDSDTASRDAVLAAWGTKPALVFGSWKQPRPANVKAVLIWDKGTVGMGDLALPWFPCTEEIYVLGSGWQGTRTSAVIRCVGQRQGRRHGQTRNEDHPTEKPLSLMTQLLGKCPPGTIADPFMGSGTTLRAAKNFGRRAIGVELEERYCEVAARRLAQEVLDFGEAM